MGVVQEPKVGGVGVLLQGSLEEEECLGAEPLPLLLPAVLQPSQALV